MLDELHVRRFLYQQAVSREQTAIPTQQRFVQSSLWFLMIISFTRSTCLLPKLLNWPGRWKSEFPETTLKLISSTFPLYGVRQSTFLLKFDIRQSSKF